MARLVLRSATLLCATSLVLQASALTLLPHDVRPGHAVRQFTGNHSSYTLIDPEFAPYFTMLNDGLLMTTADLSPLLDRPLQLAVLEKTPYSSTAHAVHLLVMDRRKLLHFPSEEHLCGEIPENAPPYTPIDLPPIRATAFADTGPLAYKIIKGNEKSVFALRDRGTKYITPGINSVITDGDVEIVAITPLDTEEKSSYSLVLQATDLHGVNKANLPLNIDVVNENDHTPIFEQDTYYFAVNGTPDANSNGTAHWQRFGSIGKVRAFDEDGDRVYYSLSNTNNLAVIVPQTGELILVGEPDGDVAELQVLAHDTGEPPRVSLPARVHLEFVLREQRELQPLRRDKRRVTRAVRPTKRIEFTEADGASDGHTVFILEKETERETFQIRDDNPWVTVEPSGAVKVKKKWDYEELGPEKTIDFWVTITNPGNGGESFIHIL